MDNLRTVMRSTRLDMEFGVPFVMCSWVKCEGPPRL
jgi:hypothetical protein